MTSYKDAATKAAQKIMDLTGQFANTGFDQQRGWLVRARDTNDLETISVKGEANTFVIPVQAL